mgnify:CR=1 FL=1
MMPPDPKDDLANDWFNSFLPKLRFEQDYYIYPGSSEKLMNEDGSQKGISIKRPDIRLFSTGITKLYEMIVEGKEYPDVVYTPEEETKFDENMKRRFPEVFAEEEK